MIERPLTWPRFRFAQAVEHAAWRPVNAEPDDALAADGWKLGGPCRDASALSPSEQDELWELIDRPVGNQTTEQRQRESKLLDRCPFGGVLPPIDLDCPRNTPHDIIEAAARAFTAAWCQEPRLGLPAWCLSGGSGAHGDLQAPNLWDRHLLQAAGVAVRAAARRANLPLLSDHRLTADRPIVVVDDTLYCRGPEARGVLWRLIGAPHPVTKHIKAFWTAAFDDHHPAPVTNLGPEIVAVAAEEEPLAVAAPGTLKTAPGAHPTRPLARVATLVQRHLPPSGQRHQVRLAIAGWLLREGIPLASVQATLRAAGDTTDGEAATATTAQRLASGLPSLGFRRLAQQLGSEAGDELKAALAADLKGTVYRGDLSGYLTDNERQLLIQAAKLADQGNHWQRARSLRLAAFCGWSHEDGECQSCLRVDRRRWLVAERATCPHCAFARARAIYAWAVSYWPEKMGIAFYQLADATLPTARAKMVEVREQFRNLGLGAYVRTIMGPGWVCAVTAFKDASLLGPGLPNLKIWGDKAEALAKLLPLLTARVRRTRTLLQAEDAEGLAADEWVDRILSTTAGRKASAAMPWPTKADIRLFSANEGRRRRGLAPLTADEAKAAREERKHSTCCGAGLCYHLADRGGVVASRNDRPWDYVAAASRLQGVHGVGVSLSPKERTRGVRLVKGPDGLRAIYPPG